MTAEQIVTVRLVFDVTLEDTSRALGSGDIDVLATSRLLAWCEVAALAAVTDDAAVAAGAPMGQGTTTVGTRVRMEHLLPTPIGGQVTVQARLVSIDGRTLRVELVATDRHGAVLATGGITRVIVDRDRFAARIPAP